MSRKDDEEKDSTLSSVNGAALRGRAEEEARAMGTQDLGSLSPEESVRLLHELQVHQIELETQNEELRRAQEELEASRARYFGLYDLAPVGYFTLSEHCSILGANLTAATLLGLPKSSLTKTLLTRFILPDDQDTFYRHWKRLFETGEPQGFEIRLLRSDGVRLWVGVKAYASQDAENGAPVCRAVMIDITELKLIESTQLFLAKGAWVASGEHFFESLARHLGESLGMDFVCIDRLEGDRLSARTLAVYFDGKFDDNVTYALQDTPCGEVVQKDICCFPKNVRHLFPKDQLLQEMKAESYVGTILWDSKGQPIGLIAVIGRQPLANPHLTESILRLVGVRAAGELERKQAEVALRESEERFHRLFEDDLTGDFFCTPEGRILLCNPAFATIFGFSSRDEAVGTSMLDLYIDPGERDSMLKALKREGKLGRYGAWRKRRDGKPIYVVENLVGHFNDRGELYEIKGYIFDDTERKRAEEELKESEESLARAQSISHLANWEMDVRTKKVRGSDELYRMFNLEADFTLDAYGEKFHPEDRANVLESIHAALYEGKPYNIDYRIVPRANAILHVHAEGEVTYDEAGLPIKFFGIVQDITERREMEQEIRRAKDELEFRVEERTKELEQRNQDLENFTFAAAHHLQEPLRKIQVFADLFSTKYAEGIHEQGRHYLQRMQETASRMRDLLQGLLGYSRLIAEAGSFTRVSLNEIAHEVVTGLAVQIRESGATVEIGELPEIDADRRQLFRLFQNLIANGVKFRREGVVPWVKIHTDCSEESKSGACDIFVEDNGIGFDEEHQDRIFMPFQRLHGRTEYSGVGMGLAICKRVMERHNGHIRVKSTPGRGSTFILTLPVRQIRSTNDPQ